MLVGIGGGGLAVEDDWNRGYDEVHLPEIVECPGFIEAARYVTADDGGQRHYQTIYRLESPEAIHTVEFSERRGWYQFDQHVNANVRLFQRTGATND